MFCALCTSVSYSHPEQGVSSCSLPPSVKIWGHWCYHTHVLEAVNVKEVYQEESKLKRERRNCTAIRNLKGFKYKPIKETDTEQLRINQRY